MKNVKLLMTGVPSRLQTLSELGCVELTETRQVSTTTLFSKRSDLVWYEGKVGGCLRFGDPRYCM